MSPLLKNHRAIIAKKKELQEVKERTMNAPRPLIESLNAELAVLMLERVRLSRLEQSISEAELLQRLSKNGVEHDSPKRL